MFNRSFDEQTHIGIRLEKEAKLAIHIACAVFAKVDYFLTTDDKVIKKADTLTGINITDPIDFIKKPFPC